MKKSIKRILAGALSLCMMLGVGTVSAFAADGAPQIADDYVYTAKMNLAVDDPFGAFTVPLFDTDVYVTVNKKLGGEPGYNFVVHAYTVANFPHDGTQNSMSDFVLIFDNVKNHYRIQKGKDWLEERTFDLDSESYKIHAGDYLLASPINIPTQESQIRQFSQGVKGYYAFGTTVVDCTMTLTDYQLVRQAGKPVEPVAKPDETTEKSMQLTAAVEAPRATYRVKIPEAVALGTLSAEEDTVQNYTVQVTAENLGAGRVEVSAPAETALRSGESTLTCANSFGTQQTGVSTELKGAFTVQAADVKAAAAGNYTGTATFHIAYFAEK